jgi:hypothetical protein
MSPDECPKVASDGVAGKTRSFPRILALSALIAHHIAKLLVLMISFHILEPTSQLAPLSFVPPFLLPGRCRRAVRPQTTQVYRTM